MDVSTSPDTPNGTTPAERVLDIVRQMMRETHPSRLQTITLHTSFERDLGLDSLARVELMLRLGQAFGIELPMEALSEADTPSDLLRLLGPAPQGGAPETAAASGTAAPPEVAVAALDVPEQAQTLLDVLEWHATRRPDQTQIVLADKQHTEQTISYRDLRDGAQAIAAGLTRRGLQALQTVALMLPTGRDYLLSFLGVMLAGGIPVPIYPPARLAQLEEHLKRHARILSNAQAAFIITVEEAKQFAIRLQAAVPSLSAIVTPGEIAASGARNPPPTPPPTRYRPQSGDIAFLQYTSGSTGEPKGVALTHANLLANIRAMGRALEVTAGDVFVSWLPLYHDMGLIGAWLGSLYHGFPLVLMSPLAFLARPTLWLETIARHHGTISGAPNFAYDLCVRHIDDAALGQLDLSSWRLAFNGAEPVSPATLEAFATRFAPCGLRRQAITPVYGLAESSVGLAFPPMGRGPRIDVILRAQFAAEARAVPATDAGSRDAGGGTPGTLSIPSCGRVLPGHEIRIVDDSGDELPERQIGRLEFRGPSATADYYRNPVASAALFRDGWLDSGDHAYMAQGEVFITGRVKDLIKRGGRNLYPYDLEQAVGNLPGIRKGCVAVFASPDPATGGERVIIMAETREQDAAALAALRRELDQAAINALGEPADEVLLVPPHSVLKTSSGKIRRLACRQAYENGDIARHATAPWLHATRFMAASAAARARLLARRAGAWIYAAYAWTLLAILVVFCGGLIALLQRPALGRRIAHFAARLLLRLTFAPPAVEGLERLPRQPHILVVNHASYLDAIVLAAALPPEPGYVFTAKHEYAGQFWMRALLTGLGSVFIERFDAKRSMADVDAMLAALKRNDNLLIFPEGTFSHESGLKPFHMGAFVAAAKAGVPIVVAGLRGTREALRDGTWRPRRARIQFAVGQTLAPSGTDWSAAVQSRQTARAAMAELCGEFAGTER